MKCQQHIRCSPSAMTMIPGEGTIETSREKACYKSPFLARQLSMFLARARHGVVKIARYSPEVVLRTTKHTVIYPGSGPFLEVIALRPAV
jgi:hypothetical protein